MELMIYYLFLCWNFTYDMVKRALDLKVFNKIILASEFSDLNNIKLSQSDWTSLENIAAFLRYFAKLSTEICASTYPTVTLAANVAWNKLYRYYNKASEKTHYIATILDLR
ncbi:ribonuclease H-like domain-containing protein [Rhizophagus irregularis DAOM 181602=DAOM 197198]|nr:ribonuclease H-like domain-containing protein [Rhizophagus irregularis DAOM 181602=DAOM 197198]